MFKHLRKNNVGYFQHFVHAVILGLLSVTAGIVFLIHAVFPFLFTHTGSNLIRKMQSRFFN
jgi:hypothetical protein